MLKLITGKEANFREFEKFYRVNYKPSLNEGELPPESSDSELSESEDEGDYPSPCTPDDIEEEVIENNCLEDEANTLNLPLRCPSETEQLPMNGVNVNPSTSRHLNATCSFELEEASRKAVRQWRAFIMPNLKKVESETEFYIHDYESEIIDPVQIGEKRSFEQIIKGKSQAEMARFFVTTLHLANSNNVEISRNEDCSNNFTVKVVDKTRHHEMLDGYQAPSEEIFRERLEVVKSSNPGRRVHSTPYISPVAKKRKLLEKKSTKKQLFS